MENNFLYNKYTNWYFSIIEKCIYRKKSKEYEMHHILPESCGGKYSKNICFLTPREHYICHLLLCKMFEHGSNERGKMFLAIKQMKTRMNGDVIKSSRLFEHYRNLAREYLSKINTGRKATPEIIMKISLSKKGIKRSPESIEKGASKHRGMKRSKETCNNISKALKGNCNALGGIWKDESRLKLSNSRKGIKFTEEHKKKLSLAKKGKKYSEDRKQKISESKRKYNFIICEPDETIINTNNLAKYTKEKNINKGHLYSRGHSKGYKILLKELIKK